MPVKKITFKTNPVINGLLDRTPEQVRESLDTIFFDALGEVGRSNTENQRDYLIVMELKALFNAIYNNRRKEL